MPIDDPENLTDDFMKSIGNQYIVRFLLSQGLETVATSDLSSIQHEASGFVEAHSPDECQRFIDFDDSSSEPDLAVPTNGRRFHDAPVERVSPVIPPPTEFIPPTPVKRLGDTLDPSVLQNRGELELKNGYVRSQDAAPNDVNRFSARATPNIVNSMPRSLESVENRNCVNKVLNRKDQYNLEMLAIILQSAGDSDTKRWLSQLLRHRISARQVVQMNILPSMDFNDRLDYLYCLLMESMKRTHANLDYLARLKNEVSAMSIDAKKFDLLRFNVIHCVRVEGAETGNTYKLYMRTREGERMSVTLRQDEMTDALRMSPIAVNNLELKAADMVEIPTALWKTVDTIRFFNTFPQSSTLFRDPLPEPEHLEYAVRLRFLHVYLPGLQFNVLAECADSSVVYYRIHYNTIQPLVSIRQASNAGTSVHKAFALNGHTQHSGQERERIDRVERDVLREQDNVPCIEVPGLIFSRLSHLRDMVPITSVFDRDVRLVCVVTSGMLDTNPLLYPMLDTLSHNITLLARLPWLRSVEACLVHVLHPSNRGFDYKRTALADHLRHIKPVTSTVRSSPANAWFENWIQPTSLYAKWTTGPAATEAFIHFVETLDDKL